MCNSSISLYVVVRRIMATVDPTNRLWHAAQRGNCAEITALLRLPFVPRQFTVAMYVAAYNDHADALALMLEWYVAHGRPCDTYVEGRLPVRGFPPLYAAAESGSVRAIAVAVAAGETLDEVALCSNGTSVQYGMSSNTTALVAAVRNQHEAAVDLLLRAKASTDLDVADTSCKRASALKTAVHLDCVWAVERLLEAKADMHTEIAWPQPGPYMAALKFAVWYHREPACLRALLDAHANVNDSRYDGFSPLHVAVYHRRPASVVCALLAARADVEISGGGGPHMRRTAFLMAADHDQPCKAVLCALLQAKSDIDACDGLGYSPVRRAIRLGYDNTARWLLRAKADLNAPSRA